MNIKTLTAGLLSGAFAANGAAAHPGTGPAEALAGLFDPLHGHTHFGEAAIAAVLLIGCGLVVFAAVRRRARRARFIFRRRKP